MSGEPLPQSAQRDIKLLEKRLHDMELRLQALRVQSLQDLDDCQVLYDHPSLAPAEGDALLWDPDPSVVPFGGLWKPRTMGYGLGSFTWSSPTPLSGGTDSITSADVGGAFDVPGIWAVEVYVTPATLPADATGAYVLGEVTGSSLSVRFGRDGGSTEGSWYGSTGDSGRYGWQAAPFVWSLPYWAGGIVAVQGGGALVVTAAAVVSVLDDPGSSPSDFGGATTTPQTLDYSIQVDGMRLL